MSYGDICSVRAIHRAIEECNILGRETFRKAYGYGPSRKYILCYKGKKYDSKAILGVAHKYQFPAEGPLDHEQFGGGLKAAGKKLAKLGFDVEGIKRDPTDWDIGEVSVAISTYFQMLGQELRGEPYVKAKYRRDLLPSLRNRSEGAIERKFSNISAILSELGLPTIQGYKPLPNYQELLKGVLIDILETDESYLSTMDERASPDDEGDSLEPELLVVFDEPPERQGNEERSKKGGRARIGKRDYAKRDAENRRLGLAGEEYIVQFEERRLTQEGRKDLARKINHVSQTLGDGAGYDILSYDADGKKIYIEVKTTRRGANTPFYVSPTELHQSKVQKDTFLLYRVYDWGKHPRVFKLKGDLEDHVNLIPINYRAEF